MFLNESNTFKREQETGIDSIQELCELIFEQQVAAMDEEQRAEYLNSQEVQTAVQEGVIGKRTIMRLSKDDDLTRRVKLACLQKAKEDNTAEWQQLRKVARKRKELLAKISQRYSSRVQRDAIKAQRALLKVTPNLFTRPINYSAPKDKK